MGLALKVAHIGVESKLFTRKIAESLNLITLRCIDRKFLGLELVAGRVLFYTRVIDELVQCRTALASGG